MTRNKKGGEDKSTNWTRRSGKLDALAESRLQLPLEETILLFAFLRAL
jgi:hypothetical protein